jgi:hypothetical protein
MEKQEVEPRLKMVQMFLRRCSQIGFTETPPYDELEAILYCLYQGVEEDEERRRKETQEREEALERERVMREMEELRIQEEERKKAEAERMEKELMKKLRT